MSSLVMMPNDATPRSGGVPSEMRPSLVRRPVAGTEFVVTECRRSTDLALFVEDWKRLVAAAEGNPFYEPGPLLHAIEHLGERERFRVLMIHSKHRAQGPGESLAAVFPFVESRGPLGLSQWSLWQHPYCYLTLPLIHPGMETRLVDALLQDISRHPQRPQLLQFPLCPGEGRFHRACVEVTRSRLLTTYTLDEYVRAALVVPNDADFFLRENLSGHHFRELRRLRRKLEEMGMVEYRRWTAAEDLDQWIHWFLDLEAKGWKAQTQTAIRCNPRHVEFCHRLLTDFARDDRLTIDGLFLNGQPIAMGTILKTPPASYAFKVAFDELYSKYSPGVQFEVERIRQAAFTPEVQYVDSCAISDHPMINRIWPDRRPICNLVISTGKPAGDLVLGLLPLRRCLNRWFARRSRVSQQP